MIALSRTITPRPAEAAALERAAQLGYVTLASVKDRSAVLWRTHCRREGRPFVKVRRYITQAFVECDLTLSRRRFTPLGLRFLEAFMSEHGVCGGRWPLGITTFRMPLADAERLAAFLARLANNPDAVEADGEEVPEDGYPHDH